MTTLIETKTDKQALEDWREIKRVHSDLWLKESLLEKVIKFFLNIV